MNLMTHGSIHLWILCPLEDYRFTNLSQSSSKAGRRMTRSGAAMLSHTGSERKASLGRDSPFTRPSISIMPVLVAAAASNVIATCSPPASEPAQEIDRPAMLKVAWPAVA